MYRDENERLTLFIDDTGRSVFISLNRGNRCLHTLDYRFLATSYYFQQHLKRTSYSKPWALTKAWFLKAFRVHTIPQGAALRLITSVISLLRRWSSLSGRSVNWTDTRQSFQWFSSFTLCYYSSVWREARFGRRACMFYNHWRAKLSTTAPRVCARQQTLHTWRCAVNTNSDKSVWRTWWPTSCLDRSSPWPVLQAPGTQSPD